MKKNKTKNKIFAVAVISALLCAMFCITAFAWSGDVAVLPLSTELSYSGYRYIHITDVDYSTLSSMTDDSINCTYFYYVANGVPDTYTQLTFNKSTFPVGQDQSQLVTEYYIDGFIQLTFVDGWTGQINNGGYIFVDSANVEIVFNKLVSLGFTCELQVDPIGQIFNNISIGVSGSMTSVGTVASALTSNILLTIMCIALPIVSIGVGFFVRLKNKA